MSGENPGVAVEEQSPQEKREQASRRFNLIGDMIAAGNIADLTEESRRWFVDRASGYERTLVRLMIEGGQTATTAENALITGRNR